jgi:hypothetical protein
VLLAWTALYLVSVRQAAAFIPLRATAYGVGWAALLFHGVLGAAGAVMIFPLFIPSRWRGPRAAAGADPRVTAVEADEYLTSVRPETEPRWQPSESALVGNVMSHPGGSGSVRPVDTTRVTGASRALRATGSFQAATGSVPRAASRVARDTGYFTRDPGSAKRDTGYFTRDTGSFGAAADGSQLGRPYYQAPEQSREDW